jgi:hypothetical protein
MRAFGKALCLQPRLFIKLFFNSTLPSTPINQQCKITLESSLHVDAAMSDTPFITLNAGGMQPESPLTPASTTPSEGSVGSSKDKIDTC